MGDVYRRRQPANVQEPEEGEQHVKTWREASPKDKVSELNQPCCINIFSVPVSSVLVARVSST